MDESPSQLVSKIGAHLARLTRPNKDTLVKSLRQAVNALSQIEQCLPPDACNGIEQQGLKDPEAWKDLEAWKKLEATIKPLRESILKHGLLRNTDKDVKLMVAICVTESFRILSPVPPFEDKYLRDVFKLILNMFAELADTTSPYFPRRVKILETLASLRCCVLMLDSCDDLLLEMFNIFFSVVSEHHHQGLINDIVLIMTSILNEEASPALLDVILRNLIKEGMKEGKPAPSVASRLAGSVIQACEPALEPFVRGFLSSCSLGRDAVDNELKEFYHEILFKIFQCAPHMLLSVIPSLTQELLTDQVDVRMKAVNLIGKLFALPEWHVAKEYRSLFMEFKNRFSDKSVEVRLSALQCAEAYYMAHPFSKESREVLTAVEDRLLDFDDRVRAKAVVIACDLARFKLECFPPEIISKATERLRDKKVSVRKKALQKLMEVYRDYCRKCSEGNMTTTDDFEHIPCKALMLIYDKDCKEFSAQSMDIILARDLFPNLSVEERARHWIHLSSRFTSVHLKALNSILSQKRRLQSEMQIYLDLRKQEKDSTSEEMQKRIKHLFMKMSASFPDPSVAEKCFHELNQMKDNKLFDALELLLGDHKLISSQTRKDELLKIIGDNHPYFKFLGLLSSKCSFDIFSSEHVQFILEHLSVNLGDARANSASALLLTIIRNFPSLLRGSEEKFQLLIEKNLDNDILIQVLAKAGPHISVKFSQFYRVLERMCLEGTTNDRSKSAVSAIASFVGSSGQLVFPKVCKKLMDSLDSGWKPLTVVQFLGYIAQHSISASESQVEEIRSFLFSKIFQVEQSDDSTSSKEICGCSTSRKLKIYGLKALVKSFLPHGSSVPRKIDDLMDLISRILQMGDAFDGNISCGDVEDHIRLAAAKSVLQLSRRWDLHISPEVFRFTIMMAKDSSDAVRQSFLNKIHKLLKTHAIPGRYACAFALATSDCCKDLQDASFKYMEEFIKEYSRRTRINQMPSVQGASSTENPAYILVFLIHLLAHDSGFPSSECLDEQAYARFLSPLFWVVLTLLNAYDVDTESDFANDGALYMLSMFRAIKKAEDNVDALGSPKLRILADIGICMVNALSHSSISSSHSPAVILLPSSLYRISLLKKCDEANLKCVNHYASDERFVNKVVQILKSHSLVPASTLPKSGRKCKEDSVLSSDFMSNTLNHASQEPGLLAIGTMEVQKPGSQEISKCKQKRARLPTSSGSVAWHSQHSATEAGKDYARKSSKPILEKEILPSSPDSTTVNSSQNECQVSVLNAGRILSSTKVNDRERSGITSQSSKYSGAKHKELCCLKENILAEESNTFHSSHCDHADQSSLHSLKELDAFEKGTSKQGRRLANNSGIPVKRMKKQKMLSDPSLSEVVNVNEKAVCRRSQRNKA